jgi:hypothetical protein
VLALLAVGTLGTVSAWVWARSGDVADSFVPGPPPAPSPDVATRPPERAAPAPGPEAASPGAPDEELFGPDDEAALRWSVVDLREVREALPDNRFWEMSAPTDDPDVLRFREEEAARWNREYGKVLSGFATEPEIHGYYAHRERVSIDAIEFASHLLEHYGDALPERDVGLLELAVRLHHARLEELPRRMAEALERKREKDDLRRAWREDQAAFDAPSPE